MELAAIDVTAEVFEEDRGPTFPAGQERLIELQQALAQDAALFDFVDMFARFNADTRAVFQLLADRHVVGERKYGSLGLLGDKRDFQKERADECGDLLMYSAFDAIREHLKRRAR